MRKLKRIFKTKSIKSNKKTKSSKKKTLELTKSKPKYLSLSLKNRTMKKKNKLYLKSITTEMPPLKRPLFQLELPQLPQKMLLIWTHSTQIRSQQKYQRLNCQTQTPTQKLLLSIRRLHTLLENYSSNKPKNRSKNQKRPKPILLAHFYSTHPKDKKCQRRDLKNIS